MYRGNDVLELSVLELAKFDCAYQPAYLVQDKSPYIVDHKILKLPLKIQFASTMAIICQVISMFSKQH